MKGELTTQEMADLICYGLEENQISSSVINDLDGIINEYEFCCKQFSRGYVIGELDTFKRAACLLVAINRSTIVPDAILRASIAISVAYKMCETPYCYIGPNANIPKSLEMVNFKEAFKNNMDVYNHSTNSIIISLSIQDIEPIDQYLNLELFYQLAIKLKHINEENTQVEETVYVQKPGLKQKLLSLFK